MTRIPMGSDAGMGMPGVAPAIPFSPMFNEKFTFVPQHQSAEMIAEKWGISRQDCEEFALREPQARRRRARERALPRRDRRRSRSRAPTAARSPSIRTRASAPTRRWRSWRALKFVVKPDGVVTAGTSSQISDGAAAILVTTPEKAKAAGPEAARARHAP